MVRTWLATRTPSLDPVLGAKVPRTQIDAFIEVGQEFRPDHIAQRQI